MGGGDHKFLTRDRFTSHRGHKIPEEKSYDRGLTFLLRIITGSHYAMALTLLRHTGNMLILKHP